MNCTSKREKGQVQTVCPLQRSGLYCFANVGLSVGRPYLVRMRTRDRIDLGLSNMAQTCNLECK